MARRKRHMQGDVELNLAAMLDMAFQLLAFFILTFRPAPAEGHIALRMPLPEPVTRIAEAVAAGNEAQNDSPVQGIETVVVTALSNAEGGIADLRIGEGEPTTSLPYLESQLQNIFSDPATPFDRVLLQVGSGLRYDHLMRLLDVCTRVKLPSGERLGKLSFVEVSEDFEGGP
ncbi:MAG: biopolymer transporter ExbD [Pirellulales bacterium]|nr:biopolymer transporter ExbD [Pirellulales bacterium]